MAVIKLIATPQQAHPAPELIYQDETQPLSIFVHAEPTPYLLQLLDQTIWGDKGNRYQIKDVENKIAQLQNPTFMSLEKSGQVIGSYCFSARLLQILGHNQSALFRTGLAIHPKHAGQGYARLLTQVARSYFESTHPQRLSYGYVDHNNRKSLEALQHANYQCIGSFEPVSFSRLHARPKIDFCQLDATEISTWQQQLAHHYQHHALVHFNPSAWKTDYYVVKKHGKIVAGIQAQPTRIKLKALSGRLGQFCLTAALKLPLLKSHFMPSACRFLSFEALYAAPGHEDTLLLLMESLLYKYEHLHGLTFLDKDSPYYQWMRTSGKLGPFNKCHQPEPIYIVASHKAAALSVENPFYIAATDVL